MIGPYVVFGKGDSLGAALIRWGTKSDVAHVAVFFKPEDVSQWLLIQAERRGLAIRPALYRNQDAWITRVYELKGGRLQKEVFLTSMLARAMTPYDVASIILWGFALLGNKLFRKKRWIPRWKFPNQLYCSEVVAEAMLDAGLGNGYVRDTRLTPDELERILKMSGDVEEMDRKDFMPWLVSFP